MYYAASMMYTILFMVAGILELESKMGVHYMQQGGTTIYFPKQGSYVTITQLPMQVELDCFVKQSSCYQKLGDDEGKIYWLISQAARKLVV